MTINIGKRLMGPAGLLAFFLTLACPSHATPPTAINDLTAQTGSLIGSVDLSWTAPNENGLTVSSYIVKYRANSPILTITGFDSATTVPNPPTPGAPGSPQQKTVTGLAPGITFYFAIRSRGSDNSLSPLSNSPGAVALGSCPNPENGKGDAYLLSGATVNRGDYTTFNFEFRAQNTGIEPGGKFTFRIPNEWPLPQTTQMGLPGFIHLDSSPVPLSIQVEGSLVTFTSTGAVTLYSGQSVFFSYQNIVIPCQGANQVSFLIQSQASACGTLADIASQPMVTILNGTAQYVGFNFYDMMVQLNSIVGVGMTVRDGCDNIVPLASAQDVLVAGVIPQSNYTVIPDTHATLSVNSDLSNPFTNASGTVTINSGQTGATFYYQLDGTTDNTQRQIQLTHADFNGGNFNHYSFININPVSGGITGVSVDTGTIQPGQLAVTFTPDGDNIEDVVYINFTMPSEIGYQVELSTNQFSTIARTLYGYGTTARIPWYGDLEIYNGPPQYAPAGTYNVRIRDYSGFFTNQASSVTIQAGSITGLVLESGSSSPIADADVYLDQSYLHRSGRTDSTGRYTIHGIKPGLYQLRIEKTGYQVSTTDNVSISLSLLNQPDTLLQPGSVLKLHYTRPSGAVLPEAWGSVQAHTDNWSQQSFGSVHFQEGATDSDAADYWNGTPSTYTTLNLTPSLEYTVTLSLPGYGVDDSTYTLGLSEVREVVVVLESRPTIGGALTLPSGSNPYGVWISVEAGLDADNDGQFDSQDPSGRFYGGGYLSANEESGTYQIFGVDKNVNYLLVLHAQGFISEKINVAMATSDILDADFPILDTGGTITGNIVVTGDSTGLDDLDGSTDGYFPVYINGWSPTSYLGSFSMASLPTNATQTSGSYSLSGLEDGTYQIYVGLPGFESSPPGPASAVVTSGSGTKDLTFLAYSGSLTGTITLPGGNSDYGNVQIDLLPYDQNLEDVSTTPSGSSYSFSQLGTGYYTMRAYYATTGYISQKSVSIVNGQASSADVDLTGVTRTVSGTVTTTAGSPFNSMTYLIYNTTSTPMFNEGINSSTQVPANRIVLERLSQDEFNGEDPNGSSGEISYDPKEMYFGFYDQNGAYSIPNIPEGSYRIYNNGEMDGDTENGNEISQIASIIHVNGNITQNFQLSDGYHISGTLRIVSGVSEQGREMYLYLQNNRHQTIASKQVTITGTSVSFQFDHIPPGNYLLGTRDNVYPIKYVARDISVEVEASDVTGKEINLLSPARIQGQLRIATSGELLNSSNYQQFLPSDFFIEARSNPWVQGNWGSAVYPLIDSTGMFNIYLNPGTYDILLRNQTFIGEGAIAQGKKQFVALNISGIEAVEGVTKNLGVIDLEEGTPLSGTVTNMANTPLFNVLVIAFPSGERRKDPITATTNNQGQFTLYGLDSDLEYDVVAAPRPDPHDSRFQNFDGPRYGEVRKNRITVSTSQLSFKLELANGVVRGRAITPDNGPLLTPFESESEPGAMIIMNKIGTTPENNPLGDIEVQSQPDGTFEVAGLTPGVYNLWVLAEGYSNGSARNINVGNTTLDLGNISVVAGNKMYGTLTKPDGSLPNENDAGTVVAVRDNFRDLIIGSMETDASGNITGYVLSGFQNDKAYDVLLFNDDNDVLVLTTGLIVNETTQRNFVITDSVVPTFLTLAQKGQSSTLNLTYEFTKPLRNSTIDLNMDNQADDSDLAERITVISGNSSGLTFPVNALSSDRRRLIFTYTPGSGETKFVLRTNVTFNALDANGSNYSLTKDTTFYIGIGKSKTEKITNIGGGKAELPDNSEFSAQAGTFGDDASGTVEITFRSADDADTFAGAPNISGALAVAAQLGMAAYPDEMAQAMAKAKTSDINPLSSFYDIFLPANVSHFFPEGKEAQICLNYNSGVADPYSLNIYYYNPTTNEYLLENQNKSVDTVNERICASIAHASVFTILDSSDSIVTGGSYNGELALINFPNPFNLKSKTVTLQDPGSASASQTIEGTMIKMSVPSSMSGSVKIQIFNVAGEKVRTLESNVSTGGSHFYLEWDGKNDRGEKVASGIYLARFTLGGSNERFFKMAVVK